MNNSEFFKEFEGIIRDALRDYRKWFSDENDKDEDNETIKKIDQCLNVIEEKMNYLRVMELEEKASAEVWQYCYENGLTKEERKEYDKYVYED